MLCCTISVASFPDSTPQLFAFIYGAIKSWGVESGDKATISGFLEWEGGGGNKENPPHTPLHSYYGNTNPPAPSPLTSTVGAVGLKEVPAVDGR